MSTHEPAREPANAGPAIRWWLRTALVLIAVGLVGVFAIAVYLNPYTPSGEPLTREAHRQLGLPRCTFYEVTGKPCPACGLTTSFSLLAHRDPVNSLRANAVGTFLAVFCLLAIPWSFYCAFRGRLWGIRSIERFMTGFLLIFLILLLLRWGLVLWLGQTGTE